MAAIPRMGKIPSNDYSYMSNRQQPRIKDTLILTSAHPVTKVVDVAVLILLANEQLLNVEFADVGEGLH